MSDNPALDAALAQIDRAFGKGSPPVAPTPDEGPELTPEEEAAERARQARWDALSPEEREAQWAEWDAAHNSPF